MNLGKANLVIRQYPGTIPFFPFKINFSIITMNNLELPASIKEILNSMSEVINLDSILKYITKFPIVRKKSEFKLLGSNQNNFNFPI